MMDREDVRKLLGGYATGTLTPEEQQALFAAALEDQDLFDELAGEQSLRDLLHEPAARAHALASIEEHREPWYRRFWRPAGVIAAAACLLSVGIYVVQRKPERAAAPPAIAMVKEPSAVPPAVPLPAPPAPEAAPAARKTEPSASGSVAQPLLKPKVETAKAESAKSAPPAADAPVVAREPLVAGAPLAAAAPPAAPAPALVRKDVQADSVEVTASATAVQSVAPARKADSLDSVTVAGSLSNGLKNSLLDSGAQPIPLQRAQAMFFQGMGADKKKAAAPRALPAMAAAAGAPRLGIKWTILRQHDGGEFSEVDPADLHAGDSVKVRLIPNEDGFLSVWEAGKAVLPSTAVEKLKELETPVMTSAQPANRILTVQFTRTAAEAPPARDASAKQSATDSAEHATYVLISKESPAAPASVMIPLTFK